MKRCGKCNALAENAIQYCPKDGTVLEPDFVADDLQTTLGEKYTLTQLIGQGSMGAVYRARHRDLDDVAIKVMLGQKNAQLSARFVREAQALRRLRHPNSVMVYDLERAPSGVSYMVMEFIEGTSLRQELDRRGQLPLEEVVVIAEAVCEALEEAHEHGIIHRDIKPDNILIAEERLTSGRAQRRIKVVDFGVVKLPTTPEGDPSKPITRAGTPIGTPFYMSPEQWFGEGPGLYSLDGRTDIYALGCTLYEMLSGRVPFQASTTKEMRRLHLQATPTPLHEIADEVPQLVSKVIMRTLEKDRDLRQATAGRFSAALRTAYEESFQATAQLSAERLAAAKVVWGRSDAPANEAQVAPTFEPIPDEAARIDRNSLLSTDTFSPDLNEEAEAEQVTENYTELDLQTEIVPVAEAPAANADGAGAVEATGNLESETSGGNDSANAWAATAEPDPPAPGDTFSTTKAKQTTPFDKLLTAQMRLRDLTVPPQAPPLAPPLPKLPELPETQRLESLEKPQPDPPAPSEPTTDTHEVTLRQLVLPDSSIVAPAQSLPRAETQPERKKVIAPTPPVRWRKALAGVALVGVVVAGGLLYLFRQPPVKPNVNHQGVPNNPNNMPSVSALQVSAPPGSNVFVDDERAGTVGDNGVMAANTTPGVRVVRVMPVSLGLSPFIKTVRVSANESAPVKAAFVRAPEAEANLSVSARRQKAEKYLAQGDYPAAEAEYRQLIREVYEDVRPHQGLARALIAQKRYSEAASELELIVGRFPRDAELLRDLAQIYIYKRRDLEAERTLRQALAVLPRNSSLHAGMARLLARRADRLGEALNEAETALKGRQSPEFLDTKARVLIERGAAAEAVPLAESAVKRDPRNPAWQATLAVALYQVGQTDVALGKYRQLRQQDKKDEWLDSKTLEQVRGYGPKFSETLDQIFRRL